MVVFAVFLAFPACDGPLPGYYAVSGPPSGEDIRVRGYVLLVVEGNIQELEDAVFEPIEGIAVCIEGGTGSLTNANGEFFFYAPEQEEDGYKIVFTDSYGSRAGGQFQRFSDTYTKKDVEASSKKPLIVPLTK